MSVFIDKVREVMLEAENVELILKRVDCPDCNSIVRLKLAKKGEHSYFQCTSCGKYERFGKEKTLQLAKQYLNQQGADKEKAVIPQTKTIIEAPKPQPQPQKPTQPLTQPNYEKQTIEQPARQSTTRSEPVAKQPVQPATKPAKPAGGLGDFYKF
jgi:DNA-directed RNA polymerase subunit M/transcription elongation factor TFIIS